MSKGCCNVKSCAVIALLIYKELCIANVGDCVAIIGRRNKGTLEPRAHEVSAYYPCDYLHEPICSPRSRTLVTLNAIINRVP